MSGGSGTKSCDGRGKVSGAPGAGGVGAVRLAGAAGCAAAAEDDSALLTTVLLDRYSSYSRYSLAR
jgi:hypothetical protein